LYIRSYNEGTLSVSGLVLLSGKAKNNIVLVTVTWDRKLLGFTGALTPIIKGDLESHLMMMVKQTPAGLPSDSYEALYLSHYVYVSDNEKHFDSFKDKSIFKDIEFFPSVLSIIFYLPEEDKIYKFLMC